MGCSTPRKTGLPSEETDNHVVSLAARLSERPEGRGAETGAGTGGAKAGTAGAAAAVGAGREAAGRGGVA